MDTTSFLKKYANHDNISLLSRINELEIENKRLCVTCSRENENMKRRVEHYDKIIKEMTPGYIDPDKQYHLYEAYKGSFVERNRFIKYLNDNGYPIEVLCEFEKDILQALKETNRLCKNFNDNSLECHCIMCDGPGYVP